MTSFAPTAAFDREHRPSPDHALAGQVAGLKSHVERLYASCLRSRKRAAALEARLLHPQPPGRHDSLPELSSQYGEDVLLWEVLGRPARGRFIEVGAFDGRTLSVSWFFEQLGWTGLLIEANPGRARQCATNRPASRVVHAALGPRGAHGTAGFVVPRDQEMLAYLTSDAAHRARVERESTGLDRIDVPVTTMDALLDDHGAAASPDDAGAPIDFAVIDVEGGEPELLDGFDLDRHRPRVLVIEDNAISQPSTPLTTAMTGRGYIEAARLWVNRIYVRQDEPDMLRRARDWQL